MRRVLLAIVLGGLGVPAMALVGFVVVNLGDVAASDDRDLTVIPPPVDGRPNGLRHLRAALAALEDSGGDGPEADGSGDGQAVEAHLRGDAWDPAFAADLAERHREALAHLARALEAAQLRGPVVRSFEDTFSDEFEPDLWEWLLECKRLSRISGVRAIVRARRGDVEGAVSDALAPIRLGRRLEADPGGGMLHAMIAMALKGIGVEAFATSLSHLAPSPARSRSWGRALAALRTDPAGWRAAWATEYRQHREVLLEKVFASDSQGEQVGRALLAGSEWLSWLLAMPASSYWLKPRASVGLLAKRYRALQDSAGTPCRELARRTTPRPEDVLRWPDILGPNGLGRAIMVLLPLSYHPFQVQRCTIDSRLAMLRALVGLRAYGVEHGRLPEALAVLVPRYLETLPRDAFDGAPIRYSAEERRLWSIGPRPEAGTGAEDGPADESATSDYRMAISFPEPSPASRSVR